MGVEEEEVGVEGGGGDAVVELERSTYQYQSLKISCHRRDSIEGFASTAEAFCQGAVHDAHSWATPSAPLGPTCVVSRKERCHRNEVSRTCTRHFAILMRS